MLAISIPSLTEFLKKNKYEVKYQNETQQLYFMLKISGQDFPLFIRIFDESNLLQLLAFIPCQIKPPLFGDVARLLHMLNKEMDVPGFGMDEVANALFYRIMLPTPNKEIAEHVLKAYLATIERVCQMFGTPICAVALGHTALEEIVQKSQQMQFKK